MPGEPATDKDKTPLLAAPATGQKEGDRAASPNRANSPTRGSPLAPEQGTLDHLREPAELPAVPESEDEAMEDASGEQVSQEETLGEELGEDTMA
eukprot:3206264-Amphidinium_carterae.1